MNVYRSPRDQANAPRRARLAGAVAMGVGLLLAIAACGGSGGSGSSSSGTSTSNSSTTMTGLTGTPVAGTTLTVGEGTAPDSLNPAEAFPQPDFTELAYDSLTYLTQTGKVEPALAQSWTYVGTGNTKFDITLRPGVKFSDGSPVTAAAVKASLLYTEKTPGQESSFLNGATVTVTGPETLSLSLKQPDPVLPVLLSQVNCIGIVGPTALADPSTMDAVHPSDGAGAYVYQPSQSVAGSYYTYTANPNYYDKSRQHYQKIVLKVVTNYESMINAVKAGQIDVVKGDFSSVAEAEAAGLQAVGGPSNTILLNLMDRGGMVSKPLASVQVREALNYAVDRAAVSKALFGAYGVPTDQLAPAGADGYSPAAANQYPYDPAKAKQLLAAAGYPNGFSFSAVTAEFAGFEEAGEALQGQLASVGVKLNLVDVGFSGPTYFSDSSSRKYPALVEGQFIDPMYAMGDQLFMSTPSSNPFNTTTPQLTSLFNQAAASAPAQRQALDAQVGAYLVDNAWFVPVALSPVEYFAQKTIGGLGISVNNPYETILDWYTIK